MIAYIRYEDGLEAAHHLGWPGTPCGMADTDLILARVSLKQQLYEGSLANPRRAAYY